MSKTTKEQSQLVVKSNDIIQKSRFQLSAQQQKILLYLISKIKPDDDKDTQYKITVKDYCKVTNIDASHNENREYILKTIKTIADKSMWINIDGKDVLMRWLNTIHVDDVITYTFHEDMYPYLIDLKKKFTSYNLEMILPMRSKYAIRLYELLKSYQNLKTITLEVEDLKTRIDAEKYKRYADFRRFALDQAIDEINEYSDIKITYNLEIDHATRSYKKITFKIDKASGLDEEMRLRRRYRKLVDGGK